MASNGRIYALVRIFDARRIGTKDSARRYLFMAALQGVSESRFMGLGTGGFASFLGVEYVSIRTIYFLRCWQSRVLWVL